eukprot:6481092-Amphidinium_carterae.1
MSECSRNHLALSLLSYPKPLFSRIPTTSPFASARNWRSLLRILEDSRNPYRETAMSQLQDGSPSEEDPCTKDFVRLA